MYSFVTTCRTKLGTIIVQKNNRSPILLGRDIPAAKKNAAPTVFGGFPFFYVPTPPHSLKYWGFFSVLIFSLRRMENGKVKLLCTHTPMDFSAEYRA